MNDSRFEWKVGFFVFFGLVVAALLILNFSKGVTMFKPTYRVHVTMATVAGLKPAADVMLAGVPIGKVAATTLSLDGRSVDLTLAILAKYKIRRDARFHIDALGFLGDQYIEIIPEEGGLAPKEGVPLLKDGDLVMGEPPFNLQEAVRSVSGLLAQARKAMQDVDQAITNVNRTILAEDTLGKVTLAVSNFEAVSQSASVIAAQARGILDSNGPPVHVVITNFVDFSRKLNLMAGQLGQTISTNTGDVAQTVKNFREASAALKQLADGLEAGQGVAGSLLKDEKMKGDLASLLTNANAMTEQLGLFGIHLNEYGIWRSLWKPKPVATNAPPREKSGKIHH
jgi:phospholipid/cholesterol/gamma-HCH transport system substrate-binding protein